MIHRSLNNSKICRFNAFEYFRSNSKTNHYTQMVWGNTTHIGCGVVIAKEENKNDKGASYIQHLVCNYGSRGNVEGYAVYKARNTCGCSNF